MSSESDHELLIPADRVALMMNISTRTLWRLVSAKKIVEPVRIGGSVRWNIADVHRWVAEGCPEQSARENDVRRKC